MATVTLFLSVIKALSVLQKLTGSGMWTEKWKNRKEVMLQVMVLRAALPEWRAVLHAACQAVGVFSS